jgi:hypothetical protein
VQKGRTMKRIGWIVGLALLLMLFFTGCNRHGESGVLLPCADPVPLNGKPDPAAPGILVGLESGVDATEEANRLAKKYGFAVEHVYATGSFYVLDMTPEALERMRCEPTVRYVEYNTLLHLEDGR